MRDGFWDEIGDTLFAVAIAAAIGIGAANLAVQVNKQRAAFDAASPTVGQLVYPVSPDGTDTSPEKTVPAS